MSRAKADDGLRRIFQDKIPQAHWQPIETGGIAPGVPDLNGCLAGTEVWIECKAANANSVAFRAAQVPWIDRRSRAGGRVWIAVRRRHAGGLRRGAPVDDLILAPGYTIRALAEEGLSGITLSTRTFSGGPSGWDWRAIEALVFG